MNEVIRSPEWMDAAEWIANNSDYGDLVTHDWLWEKFQITKPKYGKQEDFDKADFEYMRCIAGLCQYLLEEHKLAIQNVRGQGYRVVPPKEQIDVARRQAKTELHKSVRRYAQHLEHIRYDELEQHQQQQRDDEAAKLSQMRQMMRRQLSNSK